MILLVLVSDFFASKLPGLYGYEIVVICDDSGSMNTELSDVSGPYTKPPTRWDELQQTVSVVITLANIFDRNGVDIYFLNRESVFNVRSSKELISIFARPPEEYNPTPIARTLRTVFQDKKKEIEEGRLLILLATDGEPTDDYGNVKIDELRRTLKKGRKPPKRVPISIIACTDDKASMVYLNNWDEKIPDLDVVDDYKSEKKEIRKRRGRTFAFSFGDYIVKILLGAIDRSIDVLDEDEYEQYGSAIIAVNNAPKNRHQSSCLYYFHIDSN
ncbi:unnamed protein product [Adineta steineri]|uniref:VWFA domain-containing protein n=1 Tax=Adineta steineri TaxID=433720 RepID=A0A819Z9T4_9BILA|nr:unnamed protein product [Adineta steineri]